MTFPRSWRDLFVGGPGPRTRKHLLYCAIITRRHWNRHGRPAAAAAVEERKLCVCDYSTQTFHSLIHSFIRSFTYKSADVIVASAGRRRTAPACFRRWILHVSAAVAETEAETTHTMKLSAKQLPCRSRPRAARTASNRRLTRVLVRMFRFN